MKFRMDREALADAVAWTARSLPSRPTVPVLAGLLLTVDGDTLTVSGFDYEVSARAAYPAGGRLPDLAGDARACRIPRKRRLRGRGRPGGAGGRPGRHPARAHRCAARDRG